MCTFSQDEADDMNIERILKDEDFWKNCISQAHHFFATGILPELLGKWYSRSNKVYAISFDKPGPSRSTSSNESTFCYCNGPEEGDMIACDNETCSIE